MRDRRVLEPILLVRVVLERNLLEVAIRMLLWLLLGVWQRVWPVVEEEEEEEAGNEGLVDRSQITL